jgi:hypothetical protein
MPATNHEVKISAFLISAQRYRDVKASMDTAVVHKRVYDPVRNRSEVGETLG